MMAVVPFVLIVLVLGFGWVSYRKVAHPKWLVPSQPFPEAWRKVLRDEVAYYGSLDPEEQKRFEYKVQEFLLNCRITGIQTKVELVDKLFVASSAVIPIFGFDSWRYTNIREVLLYPTMFNKDYDFEGGGRNILGMVGNKNMEGVMILSQQALRQGFRNETDKQNTAIHEFVHLLDKSDGDVDGIPKLLLEKQYAIPWIHSMNEEIERIAKGKSDINPYGATNKAEFFSVISEYFFERPDLLEQKHPELYQLLEQIFNQDMADRKRHRPTPAIGPKQACVCESGKPFKACCGKEHYQK